MASASFVRSAHAGQISAMAARAAREGLTGVRDDSGDDSDVGDPAFDLAPAAEKRRMLRARQAAEKADTAKATRKRGAAREAEDTDVIFRPRHRAAPAAQEAAAQEA